MGVLEYSVWINATPERVWRTYVDPARIPGWQTGKPVVEDAQGAPGASGSTYVSRRGPLSARTTVLTADPPEELATRVDAYLGLQLEVTSRLVARAGGTDLMIRVETIWRRRLGPLQGLVEMAILNPGEAGKELANLKMLIEGDAE